MSRLPLGIAARVAILGFLFLLEKIFLNSFVDFDRAQAATGFGALVRDAQHVGFRLLVVFAAATVLFAYVGGASRLAAADLRMRSEPLRPAWMIPHLLCIGCLAPLSYLLYRGEITSLPLGFIVSAWLLVAAAGAACASRLFAPPRVWVQAINALGNLWVYAALVALASAAVLQLSQRLWTETAAVTFTLVRAVLAPILPSLTADATTHVLATPTFAVEVSELCSGLEGIGLILAFTAAWLIYFRREFIFPRALILVPLGVTAIFALNVVRLALLVLIGNAGFHDVAVYGFHSQAGWISFIGVACGLVLLSRRSRWLSKAAPSAQVAHNPTAAFLMPLLGILAAGTLSHAMSAGFEYLYPLRAIAGAWLLLRYRKTLSASVDWAFTWRALAVGVGIFALWLVAAHLLVAPAPMPAKLAALPLPLKIAWVVLRIIGAVLVVPFAEELAYRGYLMRRLQRANFETLPLSRVGILPLALSSAVFGAAHGVLWPAGIIAGLAYGLLAIRTDKLGEASIAHLTSNALIAATVLIAGEWQLW